MRSGVLTTATSWSLGNTQTHSTRVTSLAPVHPFDPGWTTSSPGCETTSAAAVRVGADLSSVHRQRLQEEQSGAERSHCRHHRRQTRGRHVAVDLTTSSPSHTTYLITDQFNNNYRLSTTTCGTLCWRTDVHI